MTAAVHDLVLADGRSLRVHDSGSAGPVAFTVLWHHGSPQTGEPLEPLVRAATARGIRLISYARPGYGGSSPHPGRTVADAANDVAQLAAALGDTHLGLLAASGGGPHALACAALLPHLVPATAVIAGIAPYAAHGDGLDWFDGMAGGGAGLRAASMARAVGAPPLTTLRRSSHWRCRRPRTSSAARNACPACAAHGPKSPSA